MERLSSEYKNCSDRFIHSYAREFDAQFFHLYSVRLAEFHKRLTGVASKKWGNEDPRVCLADIVTGQRCVVLGTIVKEMKLRPNILRELSEEHKLLPQPPQKKFVDEDDTIILEDDTQRITLIGEIISSEFVTGVTMAVIGKECDESRGKFQVEDYCLVSLPQVAPWPIDSASGDKYVLLISGIKMGSDDQSLLELQLLFEFVTGRLGLTAPSASNITRVVIAGSSIDTSTKDRDALQRAKYHTKKEAVAATDALNRFDTVLESLVESIPVDLMCGESDLSNHALPQQPLHRCMMPKCSSYESFQSVTNPYEFTVDGVRFFGTSGQNIDDIFRFSSMDDSLKMLKKTLEWGHVAPTAPDTLSCYPYEKNDPFVIETAPHVYFAGNQPAFQTETLLDESGHVQTLLVTVPKFYQTHTAVLVNLNSAKCFPLQIDASLLENSVDR